jgi:hypothetical protein
VCCPRSEREGIWVDILWLEGQTSGYVESSSHLKLGVDIVVGIVHIIGPEQGFTVCLHPELNFFTTDVIFSYQELRVFAATPILQVS